MKQVYVNGNEKEVRLYKRKIIALSIMLIITTCHVFWSDWKEYQELRHDYSKAIIIINEAKAHRDAGMASAVKEVTTTQTEEITEIDTPPVGGVPQGYEVHKKLTAHLTAYNTVEAQTDSTPCISASNKNICGRDDVIALNGYKFGTKVIIDGKVYTVEDRKASRYDSTWIDISFDKDIDGAINFGKRDREVIILKTI